MSLIHTTPNLREVIHSSGSAIFDNPAIEKVLVTVRDPKNRDIIQFERNRNTPGLRPRQGYALVSQGVRLAGAPIGQIEIHASSLALRANDLMRVAQALEEQIQEAFAAAGVQQQQRSRTARAA